MFDLNAADIFCAWLMNCKFICVFCDEWGSAWMMSDPLTSLPCPRCKEKKPNQVRVARDGALEKYVDVGVAFGSILSMQHS